MPDKKISQLDARETIVGTDVLPIVASGSIVTNKVSVTTIKDFLQQNLILGVTSVGISINSAGTDVSVSNSPITTAGSITISIPTASATNRGLLSKEDWATFNSKQGAITLTTTGTTGASTLIGSTLNIPNYTTDTSNLVPQTRSITINGVSQNLTADRTWQTMPSGGTAGQILSKVDGTDYNTQWISEAPASSYTSTVKHQVKASQGITKGQAVYVSSADGTNMIVSKASNASESTSSKTMGLVESSVSTNGFTNVITEGLLAGLNTDGAVAGDPIWLGVNGDLIFGLANKPVAPAHLVFIGIVTRVNTNNGEIFVKVQNGYELNEIHDVLVGSYGTKDILYRDTTTNLWKNASIANVLGYTPADDTSVVHKAGTETITGDKTFTGVATFNTYQARFGGGIALDSTTSGGAVSGHTVLGANTDGIQINLAGGGYNDLNFASTSVGNTYTFPNATGTIALTSNIPSLSGYVPYTGATTYLDMGTNEILGGRITGSTFVSTGGGLISKYATLSSTVGGGYGAFCFPAVNQVKYWFDNGHSAFFSFVAMNADRNYQFPNASGVIALTSDIPSLSGYVPTTRTLTINGTTFDLSANRSWTIAAGVSSFNTRTGAITLTSADVTTALGYTPYNSSNPSGYITSASLTWGNISGRPTALSSFTNDTGYITGGGRAYPRRWDGGDINFIWSGQTGQPPWLWGGSDGANMYVYNPSNFSVNYANSAGSVAWGNVSGRPSNITYWDTWYGSSYLGSNGDIYMGYNGTWLSGVLNQNVKNGASPTFTDVTSTGFIYATNQQWGTGSTQYHGTDTGYNWRDWGGWGGYWWSRNGGDMIMNLYALYAVTGSISDMRYKKDISALPYGLKEVMQLNPIKYHYNLPKESMLANDPDYFLGFSAQEVQRLIPEAVHEKIAEDSENMKGMLAITMNELIPVVVQAIKEQQVMIHNNSIDIENIKTLINQYIKK